jgi:hypothetical protein
MADLTWEGQPRGNGISGDNGLAGIVRLQEVLRGWLLEAYHNPMPFHALGPIRKRPKLAGPAQFPRSVKKVSRTVTASCFTGYEEGEFCFSADAGVQSIFSAALQVL